MTTIPLRLAHSESDYRALGVRPGEVAIREDRMHVDGSPGTLEWWFMKAEIAECEIAVGVLTAPAFMAELGLVPSAQIAITFPDGSMVEKFAHFAGDDLKSLSDADCAIQLGDNRFERLADGRYRTHFEAEGVTVEIDLTPTAAPWRPEAGHILFGEHDEHFFGWAIPVPNGNAHVVIRGGGLDIDSQGVGYIDRGWMNQPLGEFLHDWDWFHAQFDDYTVLAVNMRFEEQFGYAEQPYLMVYRGAELLAGGPGTQDCEHITYRVDSTHLDSYTGKPLPDAFTFEYQDGATRLTVSGRHTTTTMRMNWDELIPGTDEDKARSSVHGGAVLRYIGPAQLTHYEDDRLVACIRAETGAFYESMYMGAPLPEPTHS
ncbi:hypothetical protein ACXDF8_04370 [Mycolicibacterium sp. CBM1]